MKRRKAIGGALAYALLACAVAAGCTGSAGDSGSSGSDAVAVGDVAAEEEVVGFTAHGSEYGKSETVTATTSLDGELTGISVTEWIKNPDELDDVADVTTLQGLVVDDDVAYEQDGTAVTWRADGADVSYTGIPDQELPFDIEYSYTLDGEQLDADDLANLTGTLEVTITYTNLASETIVVDGEELEVQQPYLMASIIVFDTEHARNITVDTGSVVEMQGTAVALGVGLPGLAETLGIAEDVELPESVTITAEVAGLDLESIITVATNQLLTAFDDDAADDLDAALDDAFGQLDTILEALDTLAEGMAGVDEGIATISEGQAALNEAFPNATSGLAALTTVSDGVLTAVDASNEAVAASLAAQAEALEALEALDTSTLSEEQQAAVAQAIESLATATAMDTAAAQGLTGASVAAGQLGEGLSGVEEGLEQIQEGYTQLGTALSTVNEATSALSTALDTMNGTVNDTLDEVRQAVDDEGERVEALAAMVSDEGAWCGNADDMPASTLFIVTAQAD